MKVEIIIEEKKISKFHRNSQGKHYILANYWKIYLSGKTNGVLAMIDFQRYIKRNK